MPFSPKKKKKNCLFASPSFLFAPSRFIMSEEFKIRRKKEGILALEKYLDRKVVVTLGSHDVQGILKGFDNNVNLILANAEFLEDNRVVRDVKACMIRGGNISTISSGDCVVLEKNPFL
ncbi:U6 snRNA-associated Sm-like protein LSm7 [Angomonas deanei]|uniref:LSM domain containing protein, putative n=1 Tax=Angomonas deanei TaxID=59799 RepID=A0A7G2CI23_9TRYP|nr:U6 snRNA-associated Sm-like protein LSm7 [Angomonas deanei]CAD2217872.1 LSM domain containing protein, putative [Angomonas deanei]|eukprot:EPY37866.1 U6 snRNA-associated Sm-like protein LSm7 [Angomonas deanei]